MAPAAMQLTATATKVPVLVAVGTVGAAVVGGTVGTGTGVGGVGSGVSTGVGAGVGGGHSCVGGIVQQLAILVLVCSSHAMKVTWASDVL